MTIIFEKIRMNYERLSKQQKVIADYIMNKGPEVAFFTAQQIAEGSGVSQPTVIRFTQALGYENFSDVGFELQQVLLKQYLPLQKLRDSFHSAPPESGNWLHQTLQNEESNLQALLVQNQEKDVVRAIDLLLSAKHIYMTSSRSSYSLIYYMGFPLTELVDNISYFKSSDDQAHRYIANIDSDDVLLTVCFERYAKTTVTLTKYAADYGASIIGITDSLSSPIYPISTVPLLACQNTPFYSYASAMILLNTLMWAFEQGKKEEIEKTLDQKLKILLDKGTYI